MNNIRVITFDAGGTLLFPYPSVGTIYSEVIEAYGISISPELLENGFRRAWKEAHLTPRVGINEHSEKHWWRTLVRNTLSGHKVPDQFDEFFEELWIAFAAPHRWKLFDQARETLQELKRRGYSVCLLSNWDHRLRTLIEGLQLNQYFDELFISSEIGYEKPDERIFKKVEDSLKLPARAFLHVGDSVHHDINGAKAVGWKSVHITHQPNANFAENQISILSDLLRLVPEKNN
jgi:putative hydrolase of the HAD superfamily